MKIAVTGSVGIGKSTLVKALSEAFALPVIKDEIQPVYDAIKQMQVAMIDQHKYVQAQVAFVKACEHWLQKRDKALQAESYVCELSAIDLLAVWLDAGVFKQDEQLLLNIVTVCKRLCDHLDLIILPPLVQMDVEQNHVIGANFSSDNKHKLIASKLHDHALKRGLLEQLVNANKLYLPPEADTLELRLQLVTQVLKHMGKIQ